MRLLGRSVFVVVAFSLAACGTVPLRSLSALSRIDAQTTDLSALRVAPCDCPLRYVHCHAVSVSEVS